MFKKLFLLPLSMALILCLLIPLCVNAAIYTVSNLNDTIDITDTDNYKGSLREAISKANNTTNIIDRIEFSVSGPIELTAPLPIIIDSQLAIDGTTADDYIDWPVVELDGTKVFDNGITIDASGVEILGLSIHSFFFSEIKINGSDNNHIHNNCIGLNPDHTVESPNSPYGIVINNGSNNIVNNNIIGGISSGAGILIAGTQSKGNEIKANYIGTDANSMNLGNDVGISVASGAIDNDIQNNTIANNRGGVIITGSGTTGNRILGNLIFANDEAGIISADPKTNMPVLITTEKDPVTGEIKVSGRLDADPGNLYRIDFFASVDTITDNGKLCIDKGEVLLGYLSSQSQGEFVFSYNPPVFSYILTATATRTDTRENTSVFSCKNNPPVNTVPDLADNPQKTAPGVDLVFSSTNTIPNIIKVNDPDDADGTIELDITLSVDIGELSIDKGITFVKTFTLSDTVASINSSLDGLIFKPAADDALITITAQDKAPDELGGAGQDTDIIKVIVSTTDQPPTIANPLTDISVSEGTVNTIIDLSNVFTDIDNPDSGIIKTFDNAADNTNPSLLTGSITDNTLTLTYQAGQTGTADITIHAESNTKTVSDIFTIVVKTVNHAPVLDNTKIKAIPAIIEDTPAVDIAGILVSEIVLDSITDIDGTDALEGIAIISADNSGGTWQFDEDGDGTLSDYSDIQISTNEALLLRDPAMLRFLPDTDFSGDTSLSFRAWDRTGGGINGNVIGLLSTVTGGTSPFSSEIGKASLTVTPINDRPVIEDINNYTATENKEFSLTVKANEPDGDTLFWSLGGTGIPSGMTITDNGDNTARIQWTPGEGELTAAVEVIASDNENTDAALFDTKSFSITVNTVNDPPRITATPLDLTKATEGIAYEYEVLVSDPEDNRADLTWALTQKPSGMTIDSSGIIRWKPEDDELTSASVSIQVTDTGGESDNETFTISVSLVNDAPAFISTNSIKLTPTSEDVISTGTNVSNLIGSNINDPDGPDKGIAVTKTDSSGHWEYSNDGGVDYLLFPPVSETQALLLNHTAVIRFIPARDFFGEAAISFRAWDQSSGANGESNVNTGINGGSTSFSTSQLNALINVTPVNDKPFLTALDPPAVNEDAGPKTLSHWAVFNSGAENEKDLPDLIAGYKINNVSNTGLFEVLPAINTDGDLTYTPAQDANGTSSFDVTIKDNGGTSNGGIDTSSAQTFTITINPVNDAPILDNSGNLVLKQLNEENPGTAVRDVLLSDLSIANVITDKDNEDPEGIAIIEIETDNGIWQYQLDGASLFEDFPVNIAEDNAVLLADTAIIRFVPDNGFNGTAAMKFRAWDMSNGSVSGTIMADTQINGGITAFSFQTETVLFSIGINTAPVGLPDSYSVNKGSVLNISAPGVLLNDNDPENDSLTAELVNNPSNGQLEFNTNGSFSYTPDTDFTGQDTFSYKALDSTMESQETQITITINQPSAPNPNPNPEPEPQPPVIPAPSNNTPEVAADNYTTDEDTKLEIDAESGILANDSDPDKDKLAASIVEKTSNGELTLNHDGSFLYTPAKDFSGTDIFTYKVNDGTEDSAIAAVTITINPVNDRPVITGQSPMFFKQDTSFNISLNNLETNDPDNKYPDDFILNISEGENYTIEGNTVIPLPGVTGILIIPVTISDGQETSEAFNLNIGSGNLSDKDGDNMPDDWEWEIGLNYLANDANEDPDGDGYTNIEEYNCNTDPTDAGSSPSLPEVYAGPDQTVSPGMTVCLNGVHSFTPDNTIKSYEWVQKTGTPVLLDASIPNPCFTAHNVWPGGESLRFDLIVTVECGLKTVDTCIINITWANGPPKAQTGQNQSVQPGSEVILDASQSSEPDDGYLTYQWTQTDGFPVTLLNPNSAQASFSAPDVIKDQALNFLLTVIDRQGLQSDSEYIINILKNNLPPIVNVKSPSQELTEGTTYKLEGKKSGEPGEKIAYRWRQLSGPPVTISDLTAVQPTFVLPPVDTGALLEFELAAENEFGLRDSEIVKIRVKDNNITGFPSDAITFLTESDKQMGTKTDESSGIVSLTSTGSRIDLKVKVSKPGDTATAVIFMKEPVSADFSWYAFTSAIGWYKYNENAVLNDDRTQLILTITDGGQEDEDSSADGIITFLSGPEVKEDLDKPDDNVNIDDDKDSQDKIDDKDDDKDDNKDDNKDTGSDGGSSGFCFIRSLLY